MISLSLEEAINCLVAIDQIRLKLALAHIKVDNESTVNLLVESYQQYLDIQNYSLYLSATPDCNGQNLYELIIERYQKILPQKTNLIIPLSVNKSRRICWQAIESWREWHFKDIENGHKVRAPFIIIKQAEYLKASAIQELRDLNSRLGVAVLLVSDRPLHKMVENAEGKGRFMLLNYPLLLKDGLIRLKEEIDNKRFKTHEEYIHFFEQVKNNKIQEYKLELR